MPPGFPAIQIDDELYWDGGCVSNTPLDGIYERAAAKDTLCFVIDLFGPTNQMPQEIFQVLLKQKEIQFGGRLKRHIDQVRDQHNLAHALYHDSCRSSNRLKQVLRLAKVSEATAKARFDIVHILYHKPPSEVPTCDCEFSTSSIQTRAEQGFEDMRKAVKLHQQEFKLLKPARKRKPVGSELRTYADGQRVTN